MRYCVFAFVAVCCVVLAVPLPVLADAVPPLVNYQGKVYQPSGAAVPDGAYKIAFSIYDVPTGGTAIWTETYDALLVKGSAFHVLLGSINPIGASIFSTADRYLGVKLATDPELTPRQKIASVPYAMVAEKAASADVAQTVPDGSVSGAKLAPGTVTADKLAPDAISSSALYAAAERPDAPMLPPRDMLAFEKDGKLRMWQYVYLSNFEGFGEVIDPSGGEVRSAEPGVWVRSSSGNSALTCESWAEVNASPGLPCRFICRWRTNSITPSFKALLRIGVIAGDSPDYTDARPEYSKGQGFKQVGDKLYAYLDRGDGGGQHLTEIAVIPTAWKRYIGEIECDGAKTRYYLNGQLRHTETAALPFGRISLSTSGPGGLDVNWVLKSGWE